MKRIIIGAGAAGVLALGIGYVAKDDGGTAVPAAAQAPRPAAGDAVTTLSGYELSTDVKSATAYTGNELIFTGTVAGPAEQPRRVARTLPGGSKIDYVYTPIPVRVESVRKGTGIKAGQIVRVRALGGSVGGHATVSELGPQASDFRSGLKVTLFTQPLLDAGDGLKAVTPNFSFGYAPRQAGVYALGGHDRQATGVKAFQQALTQAK
ncbi:hypothetical protein [Actinomadura macrotermitis]|uniref:Uncharacterized protein n=1 Tax=Actinomadura macrotermitis TaxID=2585200 RepID=A0A7K0BQE9_9ACTN|nr:hypothetical protein [Actinomadura macrotermitis]MQY03246.1 hypothetical protein [Actinomadura macrotermitis]